MKNWLNNIKWPTVRLLHIQVWFLWPVGHMINTPAVDAVLQEGSPILTINKRKIFSI